MDNFKLGIFSWFGYIMPFDKRIRMIKNGGFDSTMLWWDEELFSKEGKKNFKSIKDSNLNIENLHVPYFECDALWSSDNKRRERAVYNHLRWINDCDKHDIPMMVMHLISNNGLEKVNVNGLYSLERIVKEAEKLKVKLAVENTVKNRFIENILTNIESPYLGLCYDSSHAKLENKDNTYLLEKFKERVFTLHLSDNDGKEDKHWIPNKGIINWEKITNKLKEIDYKGNISLEVVPKDSYQSPEHFIKVAYESANELKKILNSKG
ncbi:MAG: sugar phosphate isomerase/epimerase [Firmicutes bacterium]|nr:sugar phosphate isomerase/epimerase [Bacillota bacterium]